jgi:hypothetical protein
VRARFCGVALVWADAGYGGHLVTAPGEARYRSMHALP